MPRSAYPVAGDVWEFLIGAGLMASSGLSEAERFLDLDGAAAWARDRFEERTGRLPFLGDTDDVTLYFDPPGPDSRQGMGYGTSYLGGSRILQLDCGLISLTSLTVGYSIDASGTQLTEHRDFDLYPLNAAAREKPWEWIEFRVRQWGPPRSIQLVGKRGYRPDGQIPDGAWQCVVQGAAEHLGPQLQAALTEGVVSWKDGLGGEQFGDNPLGKQLQRWGSRFASGIRDYKLVTL